MTQRNWQLSGRLDELTMLVAQVEAFAVSARLPPEVTGILNLMLEEWYVNLVRHGLAGQTESRIEINLSRDGDRVICQLRDNGAPFDPTRHPPPDLNVPLQDRGIGGLGIYLIHSLVDAWEYRREGGCNLNRIEKRITTS